MDLTNVIIKPLLTEKSYEGLGYDYKKYTFQVNPRATKTMIKLAFKAIYGILPERINVVIRKPSRTKTGTSKPGYTSMKKIAIITLPQGVQIAVTGEKPEETTTDKKEIKKETVVKE